MNYMLIYLLQWNIYFRKSFLVLSLQQHVENMTTFFTSLRIFQLLRNIDYPVPFQQVFSRRYRYGWISPSGAAVQSCTVE